MIFDKNRVNNETDNIDCDIVDVNSSNDTATKEVKDFKSAVIKSIDKFNSYIKKETKKKDTAKEHIENVNAKKIASNMMLMVNQLLMLILRHI